MANTTRKIDCATCGKHALHKARGLCINCYNYQLRNGKPRPEPQPKPKPKPKVVHQRACMRSRCANPAMESAPWGLGFCEDCMPRIEHMLASHQGLVRNHAA